MKKTMTILMALTASQAFAAETQYLNLGTSDFSMGWNRTTAKGATDPSKQNTIQFGFNLGYGYIVHPNVSLGGDLGFTYENFENYAAGSTTISSGESEYNIMALIHANFNFIGSFQNTFVIPLEVGINYEGSSAASGSTTYKDNYPRGLSLLANIGVGYTMNLTALGANTLAWNPTALFNFKYGFGDMLKKAEATSSAPTDDAYDKNYTMGVTLKLLNFRLFF